MKKNAETRILDQNGYRQRAACLCITPNRPNCCLLVSSSRNKLFYVVPGGGIESEESSKDAALRELLEEAGIRGRIIRSIGTFNNEDRKHSTEVFLVEVVEELENWLECDRRVRKWMPFEEALLKLALYKPYQCEYLRQYLKRIQYLTGQQAK